MNNYEIIISLLILAGAGIIAYSFFLFQKNIKLINELSATSDQGLPKLIVTRQFVIMFFLLGYLIVFFCFAFKIQLWFKTLTGIIFFFGALYVYLETFFNKKILRAISQKYKEVSELKKDLDQDQKVWSASEKKYQSILENINESYFEVDLKGNLMFFNDLTCKTLGYPREKLMFMSYKNYVTEEGVALVYKEFDNLLKQKSGVNSIEYDIITGTGEIRSIETSISPLCNPGGEPVGFSCLARDITEKKESEKKQKTLEKQILQAQKLEAIGHLAGGIAHDFNNVLTAISGNAKLLMMDNESFPEKSLKNLNNIVEATDRAGTLISQVLTFSRQNNEETLLPIKFDLILKEAIRFIRSTTSTSIDIKSTINSKNHYILADSTQIHQVIMNLCTNAKYAMEDHSSGTIDIRLSPVELDNFTGIAGNNLSGTFFELHVRDTGDGMTPEVLDKIFNPFYTTKDKDKGTGLGLSTVHGIVKSYDGDIKVESEVGKGTVFKVYFPVTEKVTTKKEPVIQNKIQGKGNLLLLDDEKWITESFGELFSDYGYNVDVFNFSKEALNAVSKNSNYYDVVITDFQMPKMNGLEFAEKVKDINNEIAIIISSGNISSIPEKNAKKIELHAVVQKPFDDDKL
ncbi:MAG: PAS domain S-box protein, partial [Desulfobacteraceae bacterium]|nr:PAS domain S-box protein [Desulfobacteraceae bacterium]